MQHQPAPVSDGYVPLEGFKELLLIARPSFVPTSRAEAFGGVVCEESDGHAMAFLRGAWLIGAGGAVIARNRELLWDLSYEWPGYPGHHTSYELSEVCGVNLPGASVTLAAMAADSNYFHFLLNSVARLVYVAAMPELSPQYYVVSGAVTDFTADTFALFGISRDRLRGIEEGRVIRPERLVAPPLVHHPFVVPAHVCEFIRSQVLAHVPAPSGARRRIMIDRSDATSRRIVNFTELQPVLEEFNIELVRLKGRPVREQAQVFRDAELVIANHGAALTNLVFCDPGTRVLQVLAPGMMEREYRTICQHRGLRHDYLVADFAIATDRSLPLKQRDLQLSAAELRSVLANEY